MNRSKRTLTDEEVYDLTERVRAESFEEAALVVENTAPVGLEDCPETIEYITRRIRCIKYRVPCS